MPKNGITNMPDRKEDFPEPHINFVEKIAEERAQEYAARKATVDTAEVLQQLNERIELEINARKYADKKAARRELAAITIGLLTLLSTMLFGILALLC